MVRFQQPSHLTVAGGSYCAAGLHCVTNVTSAGCAGFCQTLSSWGRGGGCESRTVPSEMIRGSWQILYGPDVLAILNVMF